MRKEEHEFELPFWFAFRTKRFLSYEDFYEGVLQEVFDNYCCNFAVTSSRYAKPYGLFRWGNGPDKITSIDFIFYDQNGQFFMNLYFEQVSEHVYIATYAGCSKRMDIDICRKELMKFCVYLSKQDSFPLKTLSMVKTSESELSFAKKIREYPMKANL